MQYLEEGISLEPHEPFGCRPQVDFLISNHAKPLALNKRHERPQTRTASDFSPFSLIAASPTLYCSCTPVMPSMLQDLCDFNGHHAETYLPSPALRRLLLHQVQHPVV